MNLDELRKQIDEVNNDLINSLAKRKEIAIQIAKIKKENNTPLFDEQREQDILSNIQKIAEEKGLNQEFVKEIFELIFKNSKEEQNEAIK